MNNLIAKTTLNTKKGRIYIHLKTLMDTNFKPGAMYKYKVDKDNKYLEILLDDEGNMKVSKRTLKNRLQSVIDLKSKEIIETFKDLILETDIYKNKIIIKGIKSSTSNDCSNVEESNKIKHLSKAKSLKKLRELYLFKAKFNNIFLKKVSGEIDGQISIFDFNETNISTEYIDSTKNNTNNSTSYISNHINVLSTPTVISLFSGMGGLDKAFKDQGYDIKFAIDKPYYSLSKKNKSIYGKDNCDELGTGHIESYKYNIGDHIVADDILTYPIKNIPQGDVYIAGIPCKELSSVSPNRNKFRLLPKFVDKFIEIIKAAKNSCKVFVIENSDNLFTAGRQFVEKIKEELSDFNITENLVDAYNYGSYQHRKRAILIGSKIGEIKLIPPSVKCVKTVAMALDGLTDDIPNQLDCSTPKAETLDRIKNIKQGENNKSLDLKQQTKGTFSNSSKRLEPNKPCISLPNVRKSSILHPYLNRVLSIRESLRLFDFSDSFVLLGNLTSMYQQVANSVPYSLGTAIAKTIKKALEIRINNNVILN